MSKVYHGTSDAPLLSVIVPTSNSTPYLSRLFDTFDAQTFKDFELVFVDDSSLDGGPELCREYVSRMGKIGVVKRSKGNGPGSARNCGLEAAGGRFVTFVDSDDMLRPQHLESLLILASDSVDIVESLFLAVDERGQITSKSDVRWHLEKDRLNSIILGKISAVTWGKLYRRDVLISRNVKFPEKVHNGEDHIFSIDAYMAARSVECTLQYTYIWCRRAGSLTNRKIDDKFLKDFIFVSTAKLARARGLGLERPLLERLNKQYADIVRRSESGEVAARNAMLWFKPAWNRISSTQKV